MIKNKSEGGDSAYDFGCTQSLTLPKMEYAACNSTDMILPPLTRGINPLFSVILSAMYH